MRNKTIKIRACLAALTRYDGESGVKKHFVIFKSALLK